MQTLSVWLWLAAALAPAQTLRLTVNTDSVLHGIDAKIYGLSLEPPIDGGLWGEVVWNRSFQETLAQGVWKVNRGVLEASGSSDSRFGFGDATWRDYDLTVDALRPAGGGVLAVGNANYALALGGPGGFELWQTGDGARTVLQTSAGQMENARWYRVRIRVEGARLAVWVDGKALFDLATKAGPASGRAFVGVQGGPASFANLSVSSAEGAPLLGGVPTAARYWHAVGRGEIALGSNALRIVSRDDDSGVEQTGYAARAGDALRGSLRLTGSGPGLVVRLCDGDTILAEQSVVAPGEQAKDFPLLLNPTAGSRNATLRILARPGSDVRLEQVSLMPDSYRANGGFRPDLTQAVAALRPPVLRWSGGLKRAEPPAFGVDEFVAFARKVGAEPILVIPTRASAQDAADMVSYCSAQGKAPYRVKYWEIDGAVSRDLVPAMKKVDPAIRIVAREGSSGVTPETWQLANYLSVKRFGYPDPARAKNPKLKLFVSDWKRRVRIGPLPCTPRASSMRWSATKRSAWRPARSKCVRCRRLPRTLSSRSTRTPGFRRRIMR